MEKHLRLFIFLILLSLLSGCTQLSVTPCMELTQLTREPDAFNAEKQLELESELDSVTLQTLHVFPLKIGSTWIYEYLGFDENMEVIWRVSETVVDAKIVDGYYLAEIERTAECHEGDPTEGFVNTPETGTFWYLVDGTKLYFFEEAYSTRLEDAWLELVIPFPEEEGWYPDPELRTRQEQGLYGYRQVSEPYQEVLPIGGLFTCYNISTNVDDAKTRQTFCETIGILYKEYIYFEKDFGYRVELVGFSVQ